MNFSEDWKMECYACENSLGDLPPPAEATG